MSYDEKLAERLRDSLGGPLELVEKRMMGGLCFMIKGHMVAGIDRDKGGADRFMFRVGKYNEAEALKRPGAQIVDMGGRRIGGLVFVDAEQCRGKSLAAWSAIALRNLEALPPKPAKPRPKRGGPRIR